MALPPAIGQAFRMAAAELGMRSAARLFLRELMDAGGVSLVHEARDHLGREFPVLDFVAERWLAGEPDAPLDPAGVIEALRGVTRLLVVGLEADCLDALVPRLSGVEAGLVTDAGGLDPDFHRVLANYDGLMVPVALSDLQRWAGRRSALLTFVYGTDGHSAHVSPSWLRVSGPDVRTQFRSLIGWDILGRPMTVYPRWMVETSRSDFSRLVGPPSREPAPAAAAGGASGPRERAPLREAT
ncbi:hypothetical protein SOCEGT47_020660 [Sorangium cellulosum]|uniref:Uncharacterized protein n=1 Tax=Sorangium cellulosum TaxID=56 RepID=A0A4P2PXU2_SORCE|nr:hypothetical protein [Sorangium cellulosum]AUX21580.1 hypothetical protein SOCEGT47_020660 [Sorangium cellulosum]